MDQFHDQKYKGWTIHVPDKSPNAPFDGALAATRITNPDGMMYSGVFNDVDSAKQYIDDQKKDEALDSVEYGKGSFYSLNADAHPILRRKFPMKEAGVAPAAAGAAPAPGTGVAVPSTSGHSQSRFSIPSDMPYKRLSGYKRMLGMGVVEEKTNSGKEIPDIDSDVYRDVEKFPGYNTEVNPITAHSGSDKAKLLVRRLPDWSKRDHMEAYKAHEAEAERKEKEWNKLREKVHKATFGKKPTFFDYKISGIGRDEYPEEHKETLRKLAHDSSAHKQVALAHKHAATFARIRKEDMDEAFPERTVGRVIKNMADYFVKDEHGKIHHIPDKKLGLDLLGDKVYFTVGEKGKAANIQKTESVSEEIGIFGIPTATDLDEDEC